MAPPPSRWVTPLAMTEPSTKRLDLLKDAMELPYKVNGKRICVREKVPTLEGRVDD